MLYLSVIFKSQFFEPSCYLVLFIFKVVTQLLELVDLVNQANDPELVQDYNTYLATESEYLDLRTK